MKAPLTKVPWRGMQKYPTWLAGTPGRGGGLGLLPGSLEGGEEEGHQQCDDGDDHEQFDQCEGLLFFHCVNIRGA